VAQANFWTRSTRLDKARPGGFSCQRPYLRVPAYFQCGRPEVARFASFDLLWSRKLRSWLNRPASKLVAKLLGTADAPPHRGPWGCITHIQVLARESHGPFSSHGSSCLVKVNGRATRRVEQSNRHTAVTPLHDSTRIRHVASTQLIFKSWRSFRADHIRA